MPRILVFAPCEKVIVSEHDNTTSIMSIIEGFTIAVPEGVEVPPDSSIPITWHVLSLWERADDDKGRNFEQHVGLELPDGRQTLDAPSTLDFQSGKLRFRAVSIVNGFPVSPAGACLLKLSLREVGQGEWQEVATYPIYITRPHGAQERQGENEAARAENVEAG
jgi:hypothetical protein